jgi:hypothetical protein
VSFCILTLKMPTYLHLKVMMLKYPHLANVNKPKFGAGVYLPAAT